jgi:hypothetical protein
MHELIKEYASVIGEESEPEAEAAESEPEAEAAESEPKSKPATAESTPPVVVRPNSNMYKNLKVIEVSKATATVIDTAAYFLNNIAYLPRMPNITRITEFAFGFNKLRKLDLLYATELIHVKACAFQNNCLTEIKLPRSLVLIGNRAFFNNPLCKITLNSNPCIGNGAFGIDTNRTECNTKLTIIYSGELKEELFTGRTSKKEFKRAPSTDSYIGSGSESGSDSD